MRNRKYIGLMKEAKDHTPMQGTAATVEPAATKKNFFPVLEVLPTGKENAITSNELCNLLHFDSVRELQKEIARERELGAVILSSSQDGGGYFLPGSTGEVRQFIRTLENRGKHTLSALRSARKLLGQQDSSSGGDG